MSAPRRESKARTRPMRRTFDGALRSALGRRVHLELPERMGSRFVDGRLVTVDKFFIEVAEEGENPRWFNKGHLISCRISNGEPRGSIEDRDL